MLRFLVCVNEARHKTYKKKSNNRSFVFPVDQDRSVNISTAEETKQDMCAHTPYRMRELVN